MPDAELVVSDMVEVVADGELEVVEPTSLVMELCEVDSVAVVVVSVVWLVVAIEDEAVVEIVVSEVVDV